MIIYIVPENELSRFSSTLNKPTFREVRTPYKDAVICFETLTDSILEEVIKHTTIWHCSRDLVINYYCVTHIKHPKIIIKYLLGDDYIRYWCNLCNVIAYPSVIRRFTSQCNLTGYDPFIQLVKRIYYLTLYEPIKYRLNTIPSINDLFESIASLDLKRMLSIYNKLKKFYDIYTIYSSIVSFIVRIISFHQSSLSMEPLSEENKHLIMLAVKNINLYSIIVSLHYLSANYAPLELRLLLFFKTICDNISDNKKIAHEIMNDY